MRKRLFKSVLEALLGGYSNIEGIVVNDGSTDNTREIVEELATDDNRIRLIN